MQADGRMEAVGGGGGNKATDKSVGLFQYVPSFLHVPRSYTKLAPENFFFRRRANSYNYIVNAAYTMHQIEDIFS